MTNVKDIDIVLKQIEADKSNIQQMINLIPLCTSKGERRTLIGVIKILVKEIHNQKVLIDEKLFGSSDKVRIPLFEVDPSPTSVLEEYSEMSSYFGELG